MLTLGVHTVTDRTSIALVSGKKLLEEYVCDDNRSQAKLLIPEIKNMLLKQSIEFSDLDLLAVTKGPGSFTGIRIGLAAMRGISLATGLDLFGVSTFDVYAKSVAESFLNRNDLIGLGLITIVNGFRPELFFQKYSNSLDKIEDAVNCRPSEFTFKGSYVRAGFQNEALDICFDKMEYIENTEYSLAYYLSILAQEYKEKGVVDQSDPQPFYIRPPDVSLPSVK